MFLEKLHLHKCSVKILHLKIPSTNSKNNVKMDIFNVLAHAVDRNNLL